MKVLTHRDAADCMDDSIYRPNLCGRLFVDEVLFFICSDCRGRQNDQGLWS